jgi:MFS family permease
MRVTTAHARLGPVHLVDGVRASHAGTYLFAAFLSVCLTTFISAIQPYVLTVQLQLPTEQQGVVSGNMVFYGELVLLTMSSFVGALSDRFGRRSIFVIGVGFLSLGYVGYAYVDSVESLTAARVFLAFGIVVVNVMVATLQADYPEEASRGKLVGFAGVAIGIGAVLIGIVFMQLPAVFREQGASELGAGRYTLFTMSALAVLLMVVMAIGLKGGKPPHALANEPMLSRIAKGYSVGRQNPKILLAYFSAFVARADLVVVGTFFTLWLTQAGLSQGMDSEQAAATAGGFFGMVMLSALIWAPVMGWLNDRMNRVSAMSLALFLAAAGYLATALVPDPLGVWMYPAGMLLGVGQMSAVTASQTLIGQEAPRAHRGSVVGMFSLFGAAGILFITKIGGRLYDEIDPAAPFVIVGSVNALLMIWAFLLARRETV